MKAEMKIISFIISTFTVFSFWITPAFSSVELPETSYDFGIVLPGQKMEHLFRIINKGKEERVIERVKTSCGCTAAIASGKNIKPGKEGGVKVIYDASKGPAGKFQKTVQVFIQGEKEPVELSVRGEVKNNFDPETSPVISVTPEKIDLGEIAVGKEKPFTILIENRGKGPLYIKNFEAGHQESGTSLNQKPILPGKKVQVTLSYVATKKGFVDHFTTIVSNDPVSPVMFIPIVGKAKGNPFDKVKKTETLLAPFRKETP